MSVECRMFVGLTVEFDHDLKYADFRRAEAFTEQYPELDEYNHNHDFEGKLLLICDGMNGQFLRLVKVDRFVDGSSLGDSNEFIELPSHSQYDPELLDKIKQLYFEYTGKPLEDKDIKYAMWTQWY